MVSKSANKNFVLIIVALLLLLLISGGTLVSLYTDWLWFSSLGYAVVFTRTLVTKIELGVLSGLLFFAIIYSNLWIARRIAPPPATSRLQQQLIERLGNLARKGIGLVIFLGSVVLSAMVGLEAAAHWQELLFFVHASPFGQSDPLLHKDIGFYVFQLPFISYIYNWLFVALAFSTIGTFLLHYADEAIGFVGNQIQFAPKVKAHLAILIALMFFLKAWGYQLGKYGVLFSQNRLFDGAGYTQTHGTLPMLHVMTALAIIGGILVLLNIGRRGIKLASTGLGMVIVGSILLLGIFPTALQSLFVKPNEMEKELPYITRAIAATQEAYGLTNVVAREFAADETLTPAQIEANETTIENIRLWDMDHLSDAYAQIQTIQQYYRFEDVDVDRYWLTDPNTKQRTYRQVWLSARELSTELLSPDSQTWVNRNLIYTHGYGYVMSPVNEVGDEGMPNFFTYDIPPKTNVELPINRMGVYFGELTDTNVLVNTSAKEFDYPTGSTTVPTIYKGDSGVSLHNFWRRLLYAYQFSDINILLNQNLTSETQVLYKRNISERVRTLLPFLTFDSDPYLVTVEGNLYWMQDAYTTTSAYPYSRATRSYNTEYNYIRNSVKIVIDAYTGKVTAYTAEVPQKDAIIATYQRIFPGIFKPFSEMPSGFREHVRYPEDMFRVQTEMYATYHMTEPVIFYRKSDMWKIPQTAELISRGVESEMQPYYVIMKLPNGESEEFILMTPYIRAGKSNMVAWMCAKCDTKDYGRLVLYKFPNDKTVYGPSQIAAKAGQDTVISQQLSLWDQGGSSVSSGNLLVIPIESSLLYVMPVYLESTSTKIPELKRVIVVLGDNVAMEQTLGEALAAVVGAPVAQTPAIGAPPTKAGKSTTKQKALSPQISKLVLEANSHYDKALSAQRNGDWAGYGREIAALKESLRQLQQTGK